MTQDHLSSKTYRARWIVPVCTPVVHDGVISMTAGRITSIQPFQGQADVIDLGDVAVLPGLVNAHTHLEFSDLSSPIGTPGMSIADWLPEVVRQRRQQPTDAQRAAAIMAGIDESIRCSTCLLGEIATKPWPREAVASHPGLTDRGAMQIVAFCEVLGLSTTRQQELLAWTDTQIDADRCGHVDVGISPHAPYSVPPALLTSCIDRAWRHKIPLAMHLAESIEERQFVELGSGPLREVFESMQLPGLEQYPLNVSIEQMIQQIAKVSRALLIHGNYLTPEEIASIARHRENLSVVYCPRTHAFFGHRPHPVKDLVAAGIRVALGTDSRASNPDLNLWNEVRHLLVHRQDLDPQQVIAMATCNGAEALGQPNYGRLQPGSASHLFVLETDATSESQLWQRLAAARPRWMESETAE